MPLIGIPWYFPNTMHPLGNRFPPTVSLVTACLLWAAGAGCGTRPPWSHAESGPLLEPVKVSDLRPGSYCEIEMVVPPTSPEGSFHCYKGSVKETSGSEVVLTDVLEEGCNEYGPSSQQRPPTQQKHSLVRVPLTGVDTIWAFPPPKTDAAVKPPASPSPLACLPAARSRCRCRTRHLHRPRKAPSKLSRLQATWPDPPGLRASRFPHPKPRHDSSCPAAYP